MIRRFHCNHYLKGRIKSQMQHFIDSGAIGFKNVSQKNKCVVVIDEFKISDKYELDYIYQTLISTNREIK